MHFRNTIDTSRSRIRRIQFFIFIFVRPNKSKDAIPDDLKSFPVYKFTCASCNSSYIGKNLLHSKKLVHSFWVSNGNVNLKVRENIPVLLALHVSDLEKHFDIKGLVGNTED